MRRPPDYMDEAKRRNMNPRMLVEFVDGSKTMVEMAAIANATGLVPDCPACMGRRRRWPSSKRCCAREAMAACCRARASSITRSARAWRPACSSSPRWRIRALRERMHDLKLGHGPYYTFYRPYHLTSLEVPLSCARAVLYGTADMKPLRQPVGRSLRRRQEGSAARRHARCDRRIHLSRLDHDL